jgi:hypothetical protein
MRNRLVCLILFTLTYPLFVSVLGSNQWDGVIEKLMEGLSELSCCRSLNG